MGLRAVFGVASAGLLTVLSTIGVHAQVPLTLLSTDPFTNSTSQHATEVEPDTLSAGGTIVSAFQQGRFFNGGASDVGFSTFGSRGVISAGSLPATTFAGGSYDRASDASVAFDAKHKVWLISFLAIRTPIPSNESSFNVDVFVARSTDGGKTFPKLVAVDAPGNQFFDKNWTVCDNTKTSPFFGNCYTEFDNNSVGDLILMSTSSDGGLTWGAAQATANHAFGLGGQPLVQPNGTVIVPIDNAFETTIMAFTSTDGGTSWGRTRVISALHTHRVAGGLRTSPLPTAEIDASGTVYVAWQDCRFRLTCSSNDIVLSSSNDGVNWSPVTRVPIDSVSSGADHFIPGLAVNRSTSGTSAQIGLTYYFYPSAACTAATCQLAAGFISSTTGGASWGAAEQLSDFMSLGWLPNTSQGVMVGDYISTSFLSSSAFGVIAVATAPSGGLFNEAMFTPTGGVTVGGGGTTGNDLLASTTSDHPDLTVPATAN